MYLSLYCKGSKRVTQGFSVRGSWRPNRNCNTLTSLLWPSALCLSRSPGLLNQRPRGPALCWMMAFFTVSYHQLVSKTPSGVLRAPSARCGFPYHISSLTSLIPNSSGAPNAPSAGLSLPHLISNFSGPQLIRAPRAPSDGLSLPHLISNFSGPQLSDFLSSQLYNSSTPTQSLEWHVWSSSNGNNCHAVQQSLSPGASVYECIMGFLPCPISSAKSAHAISFDYWPLECVTSFRRIPLEWHVWLGWRSKYNNMMALTEIFWTDAELCKCPSITNIVIFSKTFYISYWWTVMGMSNPLKISILLCLDS